MPKPNPPYRDDDLGAVIRWLKAKGLCATVRLSGDVEIWKRPEKPAEISETLKGTP